MLTQAKKIPNPEVVAPTPRKRHTPAFKRRVLAAIEQLPFGERAARGLTGVGPAGAL